VVLHLTKVARGLRKLNNYFASHAIQAGIRPTLFPGDLLTRLVEKDQLFKVLRSLEVLYTDARVNAAYRLGLKHTVEPAVVDLSVHVVDLVCWQNLPNFSADDSCKIYW